MFYIYEDSLGSKRIFKPGECVAVVESLAEYSPPNNLYGIAVQSSEFPAEGIVYPYERIWVYTPCKGWYQSVGLWKFFQTLFFDECEEEQNDGNT